MFSNNCPNFLPLLIFEKNLCLTSKNLNIFRNTSRLFFGLNQMNMSPFLFGPFTHGTGFKLTQYRDRLNFNLGANTNLG